MEVVRFREFLSTVIIVADLSCKLIQRKFCERLLFLILHLLCMSIGIYLREPSGVHNSHLEYSAKDYIRFTSEIITCACCVIFVFVVQGTEFKTEGFYGFFKGLVSKIFTNFTAIKS